MSCQFPSPLSSCLIHVPRRAYHCRICGRCVHMFDHHCQLLRTCIGERNHPRFVLTTLLHAAALCLYLDRLLRRPLCQDACRTHPLLLYSAALSCRVYLLLITGAAVSLAALHSFLALTASVSQEVFQGRAVGDSLGELEPCDLPFSRGPCADLARFATQDDWCWRARGRLWTPTEWQPPPSLNRTQVSVCANPLNNKYYSCC